MKKIAAFAVAMVLFTCAVFAADTNTATSGNAAGILIKPLPDKLVVLTFDDAVSSLYSVVAPILKEHGFGATFYICEFPPDFETDKVKYMSWEQIAGLNKMGFEVANHTKTHKNISEMTTEGLVAELDAIDAKCKTYGIPKTVGFAYPAYKLNPNAFPVFQERGFSFVRAGGARCYDPTVDHPYLIPSFSMSGTDEQRCMNSLKQAVPGKIVVLTFHGVPDLAHAWVTTPPELFKKYMQYLKDNQYTVIAMRDLASYVDAKKALEIIQPDWNKKLR